MRQDSSTLNVFVAHRPALVAYANRLTGNRALAEDVVQEAWLRFDKSCNGRFLEDARAYLYRVVRNLALDSQRRAVREGGVFAPGSFDDAARTSPDEAPTPEMQALYKDECAKVLEALAELPERTRIAFEMHRFGGAKLKEIAACLDISISLAQMLVVDAAEHCKARLARP